jgi:hypothetical protein
VGFKETICEVEGYEDEVVDVGDDQAQNMQQSYG